MDMLKRLLKNFIVLAFWLIIWHIAAAFVSQSLLLPSPWEVLRRLFSLASKSDFWHITAFSLSRMMLGMLVAVILGSALAVLTSRFPIVRMFVSPLLSIIRATPVASFIILALIWIGRDNLPSFTAFLMVLPVVWSNVSVGISSVDHRLLEMAQVFNFPRLRTLFRIYIPTVLPHFIAALRTSIGLAWKSGIAAEVLTVPKSSIGKMLYEAKLYLETIDLFAWTLAIILCSIIIERVVMAAVGALGKRYVNRGREHD